MVITLTYLLATIPDWFFNIPLISLPFIFNKTSLQQRYLFLLPTLSLSLILWSLTSVAFNTAIAECLGY